MFYRRCQTDLPDCGGGKNLLFVSPFYEAEKDDVCLHSTKQRRTMVECLPAAVPAVFFRELRAQSQWDKFVRSSKVSLTGTSW